MIDEGDDRLGWWELPDPSMDWEQHAIWCDCEFCDYEERADEEQA